MPKQEVFESSYLNPILILDKQHFVLNSVENRACLQISFFKL